jgi:hypothetical protein
VEDILRLISIDWKKSDLFALIWNGMKNASYVLSVSKILRFWLDELVFSSLDQVVQTRFGKSVLMIVCTCAV